jgi:hypothetical protein
MQVSALADARKVTASEFVTRAVFFAWKRSHRRTPAGAGTRRRANLRACTHNIDWRSLGMSALPREAAEKRTFSNRRDNCRLMHRSKPTIIR